MRAVDSSYLDAADQTGLLRTLAGLPYVAGESTDELSGERRLLVEYADPALLGTPETTRALCDELLVGCPAATRVVARTAADAVLPPPWRRHITYVRLVGDPPRAVGPTVVPAEAAYRPLLTDWLTRALWQAADAQGDTIDVAAAEAAAAAILDTPDRLSLLVLREDQPVGHATLIPSARDEVTDEDHIELVDILVEPYADGSLCRRALVAAVADLARTAELPVIGHVVHAADGSGDAVTATLCARGWAVDHRYWSAPAKELAHQSADEPTTQPKGTQPR